MLGFEVGTLPIRYLGLPLLSTRLSHSDCIPLFDHIITRIKSWKARDLSFAGRVLLVKVTLSCILVFWTSCFVLPKRTVKTLNFLFRKFLWACIELTYKQSAVRWSIVCLPYEEGDLGIWCIEIANTVSNLRHIWDIISNKETIWVTWVKNSLIKHKDFWLLDCSWCWRRILDHRDMASQFFLQLIGNGEDTKLWKDKWLPQGNLLSLFPQHLLYDSVHHLDARVSTCLTNGEWSLTPELRKCLWLHCWGYSAKKKVDCLLLIELFGLLFWYLHPEGYNALRPHAPKKNWQSLVWFSHCIPRHCFITWMALHRGLKTRYKLLSWGLSVDPICVMCNLMLEDDVHLLFTCNYAASVWSKLMQLLGLSCVTHTD